MGEAAKLRFSYLKDNWDWEHFCERMSDDTCDDLTNAWIDNIRQNQALIRKKGSAYERFSGYGNGKIAVIIGASPALKKNVDELKKCDENFILVATSSSLKALLSHGIKPRFVVMADGSDKVAEYIRVGNESKDLTLIASCFVHPKSLKAWNGNVRFLRVGIGNEFENEYKKITKIKSMFPAGGTQLNLATIFAYMVMGCRVFIFVGNELAYQEKYYGDRPDHKDSEFDKHPAMDIHGDPVYTNLPLYQAKLYLENQLGIWNDGIYINATEEGIFGVTARYGRLPWILQHRLSDAIDFSKRALSKLKEEIKNG